MEAAGAEHRDVDAPTASTTWGSSSEVGTDAGVAAALAALGDHRVDAHLEHLLGVAAGADGGHHDDAGVVAAGDGVLGGGAGEAHEPHALRHHVGDPLGEVGLVGPEVHAERGVGALLHRVDGRPQLVGRHRDGGEDAEAAGRAGGRGEVGARHPAHARSARSGSRHPTRSQNRVCNARVHRI